MNAATTADAGLYIHVPFCVKKCTYCDFYSVTDLSDVDVFVEAVVHEMQLLVGEPPLVFDTLYLGGGTPSVLPPDQIGHLVERARYHFNFRDDVEITIEVNPGTANLSHLRAYRQIGINRINIGVQSFSADTLRFLGRIHTADEAAAAIPAARRAGFANLGVDLIYGIPAQTPEAWQKDLERAAAFTPEHLSCYTLTYEEGTPLWHRKARGEVDPLDENMVGDLFAATQAFLDRHGYEQYEVSNFAKRMPAPHQPGSRVSRRSRHNMKYWSGAPYIGLGPSAHSFTPPCRRWNVTDLKDYIARLRNGEPPVEASETLTREQRLTETLYLSLRTVEGIDVPFLEQTFGLDFHDLYGKIVDDLTEQGMIALTGARCALTPKGLRFLDGIAALFVGQ